MSIRTAHSSNKWKADDDHHDGKDLPDLMSRAFLFTCDGGRLLYSRPFCPNPSFKPSGYKECILHNLVNTMLIKEPEDRVCEFNRTISHSVEIGYELVGKLEQGGQVHPIRAEAVSGAWQITILNIHLIGKILFLKDMTQNSDEERNDLRELTADTTFCRPRN